MSGSPRGLPQVDFPEDQRISYTDAVSFAVMQASGCRTAMSFDHDFETAGFVLWRLA